MDRYPLRKMKIKFPTGTGFTNHGSAAWIREIWMRDRVYKKNEVPIQNEVPDSEKFKVPIQKMRYRYKTRYRIQKNSRYRYKKLRYRAKTRYRIQEKSWYQYQNEGTDMVPHKEECNTERIKLQKGWNRHQNKILVPVSNKKRILSIYGTRRRYLTHMKRIRSRADEPNGSRKFYLPEVKLCRSRGGGSGVGTGSCGDLFGRTAPLLGQASNCARRTETRRLRKT